jgi:hypothetical protein
VQIGVGLHAVPVVLSLHPLACEGFEVHAGAEGAACPGQHDGADLVVLVRRQPAVVQADEHRHRERVLRLGPVQGEHQRGAFTLHGEVFGTPTLSHVRTSRLKT